jgi:AcrR family transcriptional regulator
VSASKRPKNPHGDSTPAPRRRRSAAVARREILDAAQRRLSRGGPDAIRLQDIARDVGISHPTILHHFGSRDGLISALDVRAIHALTDDVAEIINSGGAAGSSVQLIERVAETMDQQGLARLIAWWAMREPESSGTPEVEPAALVNDVSKLIFERLVEPESPAPARDRREEVSFGVRLAVVAMLGDALIGDVMSQVEPGQRDAERHRFRAWLAELLRKGLASDSDD